MAAAVKAIKANKAAAVAAAHDAAETAIANGSVKMDFGMGGPPSGKTRASQPNTNLRIGLNAPPRRQRCHALTGSRLFIFASLHLRDSPDFSPPPNPILFTSGWSNKVAPDGEEEESEDEEDIGPYVEKSKWIGYGDWVIGFFR